VPFMKSCVLLSVVLCGMGLTSGVSAQQIEPTTPWSVCCRQEEAPHPLKQMALTDKQIDGVLAAQKDIDEITQKLPASAPPSPKAVAQLDAVAKKHGFASFDEYNDVVDNITLVLSGIDPVSKKYVGFDAATKAQIAEVQANKQMSAKDKKGALAELNESLKSPTLPITNKGNIDLVVKNYDKLSDALGGGQQ
jgi:hypothetical protein